jgi:hypothetical protein
MPDAWEQRVLAEFTERARKGEAFADMTHHEVVPEPDGQYFRFMKPIVVQPKCLLCHGPSEQIPDEIRTMLKKQYPFDAATGYTAGELRGAVTIKQPQEWEGKADGLDVDARLPRRRVGLALLPCFCCFLPVRERLVPS